MNVMFCFYATDRVRLENIFIFVYRCIWKCFPPRQKWAGLWSAQCKSWGVSTLRVLSCEASLLCAAAPGHPTWPPCNLAARRTHEDTQPHACCAVTSPSSLSDCRVLSSGTCEQVAGLLVSCRQGKILDPSQFLVGERCAGMKQDETTYCVSSHSIMF